MTTSTKLTAAREARAAQLKERQLHGVVADMIRLYRKPGTIIFHIPNEGKRTERHGAFLKRMMMLPGAPDFSVTTLGGKQHWLELKTAKGRASHEQLAFEQEARLNGSPYALARSPEEAARILYEWGALTENPLASPVHLTAARAAA